MALFNFAPAGAEQIRFTSSPFSFLGAPGIDGGRISSTIDNPSADIHRSSGHSTVVDVLGSIGNTIVGAIAVSRIPSQELGRTGFGQPARDTQLQSRQLDLQSKQQNILLIGVVAVVVVILFLSFRK